MLSNKFPIHPATDPITIVLTKQGQSWEEGIAEKNKTEMVDRLFSTDLLTKEIRIKKYHRLWNDRKKPGKRPKPRFTEHGTGPGHGGEEPNHMPIIMQENEFVRFECPQPFFVMIVPEPEVKRDITDAVNPFVDAGNPNLPFSEYSQLDSATGLYCVKRQVRNGDDVVNQLFMKMLFVVFGDGDPKLVDPDFFCDR